MLAGGRRQAAPQSFGLDEQLSSRQLDEQRVREQATLLAPATPNVRAAALQVINTLAVGFTS